MSVTGYRRARDLVLSCTAICVLWAPDALAQTATLSGTVVDATGGILPHVSITVLNVETALRRETTTTSEGSFTLPLLPPGRYSLRAQLDGFVPIQMENVVLEVDQRAALSLTLQVGGLDDTVTVEGSGMFSKSIDGSVGLAIDRKFVANLPVNGRTFDTLIALAPGVTTAYRDGGMYSVNGQRTSSNAFTVDGVSAASGFSRARQGAAGNLPARTATGGLSAGVSMDALQEFRIQTSSFAPEFGQTPGAQVSLVTRSGTNQFHGSLFEQFRDEAFSANDWFANSRSLGKAALRQHQFGATLGGPVLPGRTFFFGSFEGLRLEQPRTTLLAVPSLEARALAGDPAVKEMLAAYPEPTGPTRPDGLAAEYAIQLPIRTQSESWSVRVDHALPGGRQLYARYGYEPGRAREIETRQDFVQSHTSRSVTTGFTGSLGSRALLEARFGYAKSTYAFDSVGGTSALAREALLPLVPESSRVFIDIGDGIDGLSSGTDAATVQSHATAVANLSYLLGGHHLKVGMDYKRVETPVSDTDTVYLRFNGIRAALAGDVSFLSLTDYAPLEGAFDNVSLYLQDTWRAHPRLSLTYGLRWDIGPPPAFPPGQGPLAAAFGPTLQDVTLSPERNVPLWKTRYGDLSPRAGFSYALDAHARTTISGGVGLFTDLAGQAAGWAFDDSVVPNAAAVDRPNMRLPLTEEDLAVPEQPRLSPPFASTVMVIDPHLKTPRSMQWNLSVDRALGDGSQSATVTYLGARGRRLQQLTQFLSVPPDFPSGLIVVSASGESRYHALQLQYRRRAAQGLQVQASYSLAKAEDTDSSNSGEGGSDHRLSTSALDIRHTLSVAASWELPLVSASAWAWVLRDWAMHAVGSARSGEPFTVLTSREIRPGEEFRLPRASLVPGVPVTIEDPTAPGGQRLNPAAFVVPPAGQQGTSARNAFRGLAAYQIDLGVQRSIPIEGRLRMQLRIDVFNVLNTPGFGLPNNFLDDTTFFGLIGYTNNQRFGSATNSLYRSGGPRVVEFNVRLEF